MDENHLDENHWDKTYIGLNKMWTKNNGTKIIWTKLAWEQRVSGLKDFGRKILDKKVLDQVGQGLNVLDEKCLPILYRNNVIGHIHIGQKYFGQTSIGQNDFGRNVVFPIRVHLWCIQNKLVLKKDTDIIYVAMGGSKKFSHMLRGGSKSFGGLRRGGQKSLTTKFSIAQPPHQSINEHSLMMIGHAKKKLKHSTTLVGSLGKRARVPNFTHVGRSTPLHEVESKIKLSSLVTIHKHLLGGADAKWGPLKFLTLGVGLEKNYHNFVKIVFTCFSMWG